MTDKSGQMSMVAKRKERSSISEKRQLKRSEKLQKNQNSANFCQKQSLSGASEHSEEAFEGDEPQIPIAERG